MCCTICWSRHQLQCHLPSLTYRCCVSHQCYLAEVLHPLTHFAWIGTPQDEWLCLVRTTPLTLSQQERPLSRRCASEVGTVARSHNVRRGGGS